MYPDKYINEPTKRTPWIIMEPGRIFVMGRSIPENPGEFYRPVHEWVKAYAASHQSSSRIELGFEYINTSSTKWIYTIIKELSEMKGVVSNAKITWYYEEGDEDMCELGYILKSLIRCSFILVEVDDMSKGSYDRILSGSL
jgi:uncharacterized protein YkuJ